MLITQNEFTGWITQHHTALYRHALWMTGQAEIASDAVQEAYYQAWKGRRNLRDKQQVLFWLLTILRRCVFRHYEEQKQQATFISSVDEVDEPSVEPDTASLVDLGRALQRLVPEQRELILLYSLHGFSYEQISHYLEIPLGTVMSRLARARKALRESLETPAAPVIPLNATKLGKV